MNNTQQKHINLFQTLSSLDLPLLLVSRSLLHFWRVTSSALNHSSNFHHEQMLDTIHYKKFPLTELERKLPCSEKRFGIPVRNQTHSIQISHLILLKWTFILKSIWGNSQYNDLDMCWKIWGSNLGKSKGTISSPEHPDQIQHPLRLQLQFFSGSKVASADSLNTHIRQESS